LRHPLGNQRLGERILEIRALSPLLPAGIDEMEDAVLSANRLDPIPAARRRQPTALPSLPLQLRQL